MTQTPDITECFGLGGWQWLNRPPRSFSEGSRLGVTTGTDTDFWRTTHYGFIRDTGHALLRDVGQTMRMAVTFTADYREQYDQAGLLLRIDERNWIKAGIEYVDGERLLSTVVTRDASDWSVVPLGNEASAVSSVRVELQRKGDTVTVRYSLDDREPTSMLRIAYFPPHPAQAGPMCACPEGQGFTVRFDQFALTHEGGSD